MRVLSLITAAAVFILIVLLATSKIGDPDTVQYLASGKYIVENGLPNSCVYTYTLDRCITVYSEWLLHLIVYGIYSIAGYAGLSVFQSIVISTTFIIIFFYNKIRKVNLVLTSGVLLLSAFAASSRFILRADAVASLPLVIYYVLLQKAYSAENPREGRVKLYKLLAAFFLIQLVFVNIHGSFPLSIFMVFSFLLPDIVHLIYSFFSEIKTQKSVTDRVKISAAILLVTIGASLLNPYGPRAFLWPFTNTADTLGKTLTETIGEYQSPFMERNFEVFTFTAYKVLVVITACVLLFRLRRGRFAQYLVIILLLVLSVKNSRYVSVFSIVAALIVPEYLYQILNRINGFIFKKKYAKKAAFMGLCCMAVLICTVIIKYVIAAAGGSYYLNLAHHGQQGIGLSELDYPTQAVEFIKKNKIKGEMFNSYGIGGYLNWTLYPEYKTFIHGAVLDFDLVDTVWLYKNYLQINKGEISYRDLAEKYAVNFFILDHTNSTSADLIVRLYKDPDWSLVYLDHKAVIFVENNAENSKLIKTYKIDLNDQDKFYTSDIVGVFSDFEQAYAYNSLGILFGRLGVPLQAKRAVEKSVQIKGNFINYANMAKIYESLNLWQEAENAFRKSIQLEDNYATSHFHYAYFLFNRKRIKEAVDHYNKTISINKHYPGVQNLFNAIKSVKN